ncbi:Elongin-A2 [Plecturocebus cupreus]
MELQKGVLRLIPPLRHSSPPGVDPPGWLHCTDGMNSLLGRGSPGAQGSGLEPWGGPGAGYMRPSSGSCASFPVGTGAPQRSLQAVAPRRGGPEADLLSCLQGPDRRSRPGGPLAPAYPPFPSPSPPRPRRARRTEPARVAVTPHPRPGVCADQRPQNLWPTPPRPSSLRLPRPAWRPDSQGGPAPPDFASRCLRAQLRRPPRRDSGACTARGKLQVRLATKTDPKKLGKYLHKLSALPMTCNILAEADELKDGEEPEEAPGPARWKKPLLVNPNTRPGPDPQDREESSSRKRREALQDKKTPGASQKMRRTHNTSGAPETYSSQSPGRNREKRPRTAPGDSGPHRAPPSERTGPLLLPQGLEARAASRKRPGWRCSGQASARSRLPGANPRPKRLGATARGTNPPAREASRGCPGPWGSPASSRATSSGPAQRETPRPPSRESARDRPPSASAGTQKEGGRHGGSGLGLPPGRWLQAATRRGLGADTHTGRGRVWAPDLQGDTRPVRRGQTAAFSDPETQERKPPAAPLDASRRWAPSPGWRRERRRKNWSSPLCRLNNTCAYDQVQKKRKGLKATPRGYGRPVLIPPGGKPCSAKASQSCGTSQSPGCRPTHDLLSAFESMTSQPQTETARSAAERSKAETGASGGRVNAKMQCVRALRDNPDVLGQVGRVPSWVLHLVLEGCTPDQLYRQREKQSRTHWRDRRIMEDSLPPGLQGRKAAGARVLAGAVPPARHARAAAAVVTANIRAAHENKPQGRQAEDDLFQLGGEAPDAPRRQEKSAGAADPSGNIKPDPHPTRNSHPPSSRGGQQRRQRPPGLPEKRAYACLSCSNAQVAPRPKSQNRLQRKWPADGQGHSRLQEKILRR